MAERVSFACARRRDESYDRRLTASPNFDTPFQYWLQIYCSGIWFGEMEDVMHSMDPAQAWSAVAEAWDANADYVDDHSVAATATLVDRVAPQPGDRVLELAAGPGSLGATWSQLVGPTGAV